MHEANKRNPVSASLTTTATTAASIVAIMLMIPSYFVAGTEGGEMNAYGQITPPSQLQEQQQGGGGGGGQAITINGAGATFPFPLIDTWRVEYQSVNPSVSINYQSIGSGGGVRQFTERTVDSGASDAPLTEEEIQALPSTQVHIPETIGSVVAAYNLPGIDKGLRLTGPVLADIFAGKITRWDDQRIKELNSDLSLPADNIVVVHRSDGSGTTFIWTSYLSQVSPEWNQTIGAGKSVQWTGGLGAQGNEGVSNTVLSTPNSIGYVELTYALTTDMDYASLMNRAGNFVEPTLDSTQAAAQAAIIMNNTGTAANTTGGAPISLPGGDQSWSHVSLLDAPGANSYPIASFSYLILYKELSTNINSMEKAQALAQFVNWAITDGQQFASTLYYVPLPDNVVQHNQQTLRSLTFNGQPVLQ
ncbi:MAG: phosphate ABC transporter substrate-binding protein PstS [Thermoproteota archaeon]|nr:phosphate ABC transporter substrate-binding protein PstS [Thermoproteota archaeon]